MSTQRHEFRVSWRREGRTRTTRIYQREDSARRKAQRIRALEMARHDDRFETRFDDMPDLIEGPTLQWREVTDWDEHPNPLVEPTDVFVQEMAEWAEPDRDSSGWF